MSQFMRRTGFTLFVWLIAGPTYAQVSSNLRTDWSDTLNPNGRWTYREGSNALPHVNSWQSSLGGWSSPQPGWARSENGIDRLPFWMRSNGTETFSPDFIAGDIVVHTTDQINGVGNGNANVLWTSPGAGVVSISGSVWNGRNIGRSNNWSILKNASQLSTGDLVSGDGHTRANPFDLSTGSGGPSALLNIPVVGGDGIILDLVRTSAAGDFVGVNLTISFTPIPEPTSLALAVCGAVTFGIHRRRNSLRIKSPR